MTCECLHRKEVEKGTWECSQVVCPHRKPVTACGYETPEFYLGEPDGIRLAEERVHADRE